MQATVEDTHLETRSGLTEFEQGLQAWAGCPLQLRVFGSRRLGVDGSDSDVDLLALTELPRRTFFERLDTLRGFEGVSYLNALPEAHTPVVNIVWRGLKLDLVVVTVPTLDIEPGLHNKLPIDFCDKLATLDPPSLRALNGARVSDCLEEATQDFRDLFLDSLRRLRTFLQARCIYGAQSGYWNGVACAIAVARFLPTWLETPERSRLDPLLYLLISIASWPWPNPLTLEVRTSNRLPQDRALDLDWNPFKYPKDAEHPMPVITPAYPHMNATSSVGHPQKVVMEAELERAVNLLMSPIPLSNTHPALEPWSPLRCKESILAIQISYVCNHEIGRAWVAWAQSRARLLLQVLDAPEHILVQPRSLWSGANPTTFFIPLVIFSPEFLRQRVSECLRVLYSWTRFDHTQMAAIVQILEPKL